MIRRVHKDREIGTSEGEPNNDWFQAPTVNLDTWIEDQIDHVGDSDYFKFTTPDVYRDWMTVEVENQSTQLRPVLTLFRQDHSDMKHTDWNPPPSYQPRMQFVSKANTTYFVRILGDENTSGAYRIKISPQKYYDAFEPNQKPELASRVDIDRTVEAFLTDEYDQDFYKIPAQDRDGKLLLPVGTEDRNFRMQIVFYDQQKNQLHYSSNNLTPGANIDFSWNIKAGKDYYLQVKSAHGAGSYHFTPQFLPKEAALADN